MDFQHRYPRNHPRELHIDKSRWAGATHGEAKPWGKAEMRKRSKLKVFNYNYMTEGPQR